MSNERFAMVASCLMLLLPIVAFAQDAPKTLPADTAAGSSGHVHRLRDKFDAANTNHDGHLTRTQAQAGHMSHVARDFAAIDLASHGYVTVDDIRTYRRAQRAARQAAAPGTQRAARNAAAPATQRATRDATQATQRAAQEGAAPITQRP